MKKTIFFALALFLYSNISFSQIIIECPADVTVTEFELDRDYESYGDPIVSSPTSHTLTSTLSVVDNSCDNTMTTIIYTALETNTGETATCSQQIVVNPSVLDDIQWPEQLYEIASGTQSDLDPDVSLSRPEPYELLNGGGSNIIVSYADQVLNSSDPNVPLKVIRTWTALSWCSGNTSSFVQVLKIQSQIGGALSSLEIPTCGGSATTALDINVFTDQSGFDLDLSSCDLSNNDLTGYLNCLAENNDIGAGSSIVLELISNNDFLNGVSTLDMVIIQRHILGIEPFDEPCKVFAADLNSNGTVTAVDLITMRKLILGIIPSLPSAPSWKIINANTFNDNIPDEDKDLSFKKSEFPLQNVELIAVKTGDVSASAITK